MKAIVLSSGSKGNTTYIECNGTKILIDLGNTCKYVKEKLSTLQINAEDLDAILITHTHVDHVKGLKVFQKKYHTKVYLTEKMHEEIDYIDNYQIIDNHGEFQINNLTIHVLKTSHDTPDSVGYVVEGEHKSVVYITDTGYINQKYFPLLTNKEIYIMESNHDIEMLNHSSYPFKVRQRILGDKGHLSNYDSAKYLSSFIGENTKYILLAHLSHENNTKDLAYETLNNRLKENQQKVEKIIITKQDEESEEVCV